MGRGMTILRATPLFGVEWKQQARFIEKEADSLGYNGRFGAGLPRINDGSLLFLQHMLSKMRLPMDGGSRIGIVFNGSPLFTGDAVGEDGKKHKKLQFGKVLIEEGEVKVLGREKGEKGAEDGK